MRQMRGASGLLAFGVQGGAKGSVERGVTFIESAQFMSHLVNIGDTRTLISHLATDAPATTRAPVRWQWQPSRQKS